MRSAPLRRILLNERLRFRQSMSVSKSTSSGDPLSSAHLMGLPPAAPLCASTELALRTAPRESPLSEHVRDWESATGSASRRERDSSPSACDLLESLGSYSPAPVLLHRRPSSSEAQLADATSASDSNPNSNEERGLVGSGSPLLSSSCSASSFSGSPRAAGPSGGSSGAGVGAGVGGGGGASAGAGAASGGSAGATAEVDMSSCLGYRGVRWSFANLRLLLGTDLPIFGAGTHPSVTLTLRCRSRCAHIALYSYQPSTCRCVA